jgi:hypothetical protein
MKTLKNTLLALGIAVALISLFANQSKASGKENMIVSEKEVVEVEWQITEDLLQFEVKIELQQKENLVKIIDADQKVKLEGSKEEEEIIRLKLQSNYLFTLDGIEYYLNTK